MVLMTIGVAGEPSRKGSGPEIGTTGGIRVDNTMRTSDPDIFAIGDAAEIRDIITDSPALVALAGPANKQGRIAADNALGRSSVYQGALGTSIAKVFDLAVASTGSVRETSFPPQHPPSRESYPPRFSRILLPRRTHDDDQAHLCPFRRTGPWGSNRRNGGGRQKDRRSGDGDKRRDDRLRPGRTGTRLRPSLFVRERSGKHRRLCRSQSTQGGSATDCVERAAEDRSRQGGPHRSSRAHRAPYRRYHRRIDPYSSSPSQGEVA